MVAKKKILILPIVLAMFVFGSAVFPAADVSLAATVKTKSVKVVGMAKFVLKGTVVAISSNTLIVRVSSTSKNAKVFDGKDKTLTISSKTTVTRNGKNVPLGQIKTGSKVKVFGVFDKKTGNVTLVRWIKIVVK